MKRFACYPILLLFGLLPCSQAHTEVRRSEGRGGPPPPRSLPQAPSPASPGTTQAPAAGIAGRAAPVVAPGLLLSPALQAPTPANVPAGALPLTLPEAVQYAEAHHPRLAGASASVERAAAGTTTARAYSNPTVEVYEGQQYARPIATPGVPGLLQHYAAYQPIEIPSERRARLRTSQLLAQSSVFGRQGVLRSVVADVKHAFYDVLRQREEVEHTRETLQLVEGLRHRVEVEVNVGEKGRLELTRAEAEVGRARFQVREAQIQLANATAQLRAAMAAPPDQAFDPQGALDAPVTLPPLAQLRAAVLGSHPALRQAQTEIAAADAVLDREKALRLPQPTLFAEYENQPDLRFWRTGVSVAIPLWDHRRGQVAGARAAISESEALLAQRRLELLTATERAFEQYQLADQQAAALQAGELHSAESAVQGAQAAYRFGERGILEVLDAQRVLQSVRDDLLDAQFARQSALIDLQELGAIVPGGRP